jgi:hypothetical protein
MDPPAPNIGAAEQFSGPDLFFGRVVVPVPNLNKPSKIDQLGEPN